MELTQITVNIKSIFQLQILLTEHSRKLTLLVTKFGLIASASA